jgi:hypothetical protein
MRLLFKISLCSLLIFAALEIILRFVGFDVYSPLEFQANKIDVKPEPAFTNDELLGYKMKPGVFDIYYPDNTYWTSTNNSEGFRITSLNNMHSKERKEIVILGDSFTHGSGIADNQTYPFLLQNYFTNCSVKNMGVGGYGTVHAYLQLMNIVRIENSKAIMYAYLGEHDNRHNLTVFKKMYPSKEILSSYKFAYIDENLNVTYKEYNYKPLPLISYSVFFNLLDDLLINIKSQSKKNHLIAQNVILAMNNFCKHNGVPFIFIAINQDSNAQSMINFCKLNNILNIDISVDLSDEKYNLMPYDDHPNSFANELFANRLIAFLDLNKIAQNCK